MRENKKSCVVQIMRFLVQVIFFVILPGIYINAFAGIKQIYLSVITNSFSLADSLPQLIEVVAIVPATIILGRFFCGWMCAFGTLSDVLYYISSKVFKVKFKISEKLDRVLKYSKYVILIFLVIVAWTFGLSGLEKANPWNAFGVILTVGKVPDISFALTEFTIGTLLLFAIVVASFFIERFFCRYLCPLGALFTLMSRLRIIKVHKTTEKCGSCKMCTNSCAMGIPLYKYERVDSGECIQCFKCISACHRNNATVKIVKKDVNMGVAAVVAVSFMIAVYYVGAFTFKIDIANQVSTDNTIKVSENKIYIDGKYEGSGVGFRGAVTIVGVTVENDTIKDIEVVSHGDDVPYFDRSYNYVANEILKTQSTQVDVVSGATYSSKGIINAVADAIDKAKIIKGNVASDGQQSNPKQTNEKPSDRENVIKEDNLEDENTKNSSIIYKDGLYEGSANGFKNGITNVKVLIMNGEISDIEIVSHGDDEPFVKKSIPVIDEILKTQSTGVDVVSGATYSSKGIINAVVDAIDKAKIIKENVASDGQQSNPKQTNEKPSDIENVIKEDNLEDENIKNSSIIYKDGLYEGSANGFKKGITNVKVLIMNGEISDIEIVSHGDDEPFVKKSITVIDEILKTQSTEVDVVSGATYSSKGIINAVADAIEKAK